MRACSRWGINPWKEWPSAMYPEKKLDPKADPLPLQKKADLLNFEEVMRNDDVSLGRELATLTKGKAE